LSEVEGGICVGVVGGVGGICLLAQVTELREKMRYFRPV
jgi:hypothetical protein